MRFRLPFAACVLAAALASPPSAAQDEVNLYTSRHYDSDTALYEAFTDATGIAVNVVEGKAGALITLSTPAGFEPGHDPLGDWLRACGGERLAEVFGNVPGALVAALLASATPMQWCGGGFFALLDGVHHADAAARFERARRFPPAFPGETFRQLYRAFHRENPFPPGGALLDGHPYDPSSLALPLLNVFARDDGIVPPAASARLGALVPAARHASRTHPGGHYDLLSGRHAYTGLVPDLAAWLIEHARGS